MTSSLDDRILGMTEGVDVKTNRGRVRLGYLGILYGCRLGAQGQGVEERSILVQAARVFRAVARSRRCEECGRAIGAPICSTCYAVERGDGR